MQQSEGGFLTWNSRSPSEHTVDWPSADTSAANKFLCNFRVCEWVGGRDELPEQSLTLFIIFSFLISWIRETNLIHTYKKRHCSALWLKCLFEFWCQAKKNNWYLWATQERTSSNLSTKTLSWFLKKKKKLSFQGGVLACEVMLNKSFRCKTSSAFFYLTGNKGHFVASLFENLSKNRKIHLQRKETAAFFTDYVDNLIHRVLNFTEAQRLRIYKDWVCVLQGRLMHL